MNETIAYERYHRQLILKGFGEESQLKLVQAKVLVVGAGGLGCPALQYLVAVGVGAIGIADDDVISISNLHRQVLYTTDDVGLMKVDVASDKLSRLNPDVTIVPYRIRLETGNALEIMRGYDVVIDGTDNFASRYLINDACVLLNKPLIYGAVSQCEGQVSIFNAIDKTGQKINYRNLFPNPPKNGEVLNCAEAGVLGVLPGIIGTMQAAEAIKLITGIGEPLINKLPTYNVLTNQLYDICLDPSEKGKALLPKSETDFLAMDYAAACDVHPSPVMEIDAEQLVHLLASPTTLLVDVREPDEEPKIPLPHRQIPLSVFDEKIKTIQEHDLIFVCQHGIRSVHAAERTQELFGAAKNVYSLKGGVVKWGIHSPPLHINFDSTAKQ